MSDKFAAEAYRAYIADTASELELKSIDISGMTAEEIYHELVKLIPCFVSRKLDSYLCLEFQTASGYTNYARIFLCAYGNWDLEPILNCRLDCIFSTSGSITSYSVFIDEDETSGFSQYSISLIDTLTENWAGVKIWYR